MHSLDEKINNILDTLNTNCNRIKNIYVDDNGNLNNINNSFIRAQRNLSNIENDSSSIENLIHHEINTNEILVDNRDNSKSKSDEKCLKRGKYKKENLYIIIIKLKEKYINILVVIKTAHMIYDFITKTQNTKLKIF